MSRFISFLKGITVEPMFIIFFTSNAIVTYGCQNLLLQKACHRGDSSAPDFDTPCPDEVSAQKVVTMIGSWTPILENLLPVFFVIFLGTWSDTHGKRRKPLVFIPVCGQICGTVVLMLCSVFFSISPEVTAALLTFTHGITGGIVLFGLGAITYISDITSLEDRAWRIGLIASLTFVGTPLGKALGGVLRDYLGFFNLFILCFVLNFCALILGVFLVKNSAVEASKLKTFEGLCEFNQFYLALKTLFKKRPGYNRLILWLSGITAPLFIVCFYGEGALLYLYVRNKFNMGETEYGLYSAYKLFIAFFGTFVSVLICSKLLKMSDEVIGILGNLTQIISAIAMCFAAQYWQLYMFPLLDIMHGAVYTAGRAIRSKVVDGNELGKVNSVFGVVDTVLPILIIPVYNALYIVTIETLPGAFYLLSVFIAAITMALFVVIKVVRRKEGSETTRVQ